MFTIGSHLSIAKGYQHMAKEAVSIGANTFQFFTRNPRGGRAKAIDPGDIKAYLSYAKAHKFGPVVAHASYTLNPATKDERLHTFVRETMADDFERLTLTPGAMYNFHPGHGAGNMAEAIATIAETLNDVLKPEHTFPVLLETMSGKGSETGGKFEDLQAILEKIRLKKRMGVCLDTCHMFDAGYDIVNDLDGVLAEFDKIIGIKRLKAIHLNDSKNPLGSHKDRHETLGKGHIGMEAFGRIINHPLLRELPFILETPNDVAGYAQEIAALKKLYKS